MTRFVFACGLVLVCLAFILWKGDQPERRYEDGACQYRMIYDYQPDPPMGLVTLGGSRVRVATSARDFNPILAQMRPDAAPIHDLAHNYFSLGKEYVLARDLLDEHDVKSILIMIEPRRKDFGSARPGFVESARLRDIPLAVRTLWPENKLNAIRAARDIVFQHLRFFDRVGEQSDETTDRNCDVKDNRLGIDALDIADQKYERVSTAPLKWDLDAPREEGFRRWMQAFRALGEKTDTDIIFLLMTATSERLPDPEFASYFEQVTGMPIITLDKSIHEALVADGKRDSSHINHIGRQMFIPWLIPQIERACRRKDGCF